MQTLNRLLTIVLIFWVSIPLSIGQEQRDSVAERVDIHNPSFEVLGFAGEPKAWSSCNFQGESPPDLQPGRFGCQLLAQAGKNYIGLVGRDNNTFESIKQVLERPLKAGMCYRLSVFLAKSSKYVSISKKTGDVANYNRPLKLTIWGSEKKDLSQCNLKIENWLTESLPIHNDSWRKYTFYIQPPKDINTIIFSANHVVEQPYNGNLLIDNISPFMPVSCSDLQLLNNPKSTILSMQQVSEVITTYAPSMIFGQKNTQLKLDTEGVRNTAFDQILSYFEQSTNYKLLVRVKKGKDLSKKRIAFLYSYIFKYTNLKAQQVEIKPYSPKDQDFFWTFENDEIVMSFDSM
ncbi:MAG: hypothetical protein JNL70_12610 [Saprospiraceae bacterium]|nr:hypothetical protein [Saprospiraceae bacterium]